MPEQIPILIVGAGPTGLTMAAALHHHGVEYRLIEKRAEQTQTSNAAGIHARTLELLDDLNLVNPFIKRGQRIDFFVLNRGLTQIAKIPTAQIESRYNFLLSIPQNISEEILNHHLTKIKKPVERNHTLIAIKQTRDGIIVDVLDENQESQQIHCRYLVACDGAHSNVRNLLNMSFTGTDISQQFVLADVHISETYSDNEASVYFHADGPLAIFPFEKGHARVVATIIDPHRDPKQPVSLLEMQTIVEKRSKGQLKIESANWTSPFWVHSKMLKQFRQGNIFFAGDAAHVHSPVGGQGMNTGMQDAYNLAWKLALTLQGHTKDNLLDSYNEERVPNAMTLLKNTERMTHMVLIRNTFLQWLRQKLMKALIKQSYIQHAFMMEMSMLNIRYEKSSVINYEYHVSSKSPLPGNRAPDVYFTDRDDTKRMDDLLRTTKHTLLLFTGPKPNKFAIHQINLFKEWGMERNTLVNPIILVHPDNADAFSNQDPLDTYKDIYKAYHVDKPCFFMVRPDNYIGCCSKEMNIELLNNYWIHIFKVC